MLTTFSIRRLSRFAIVLLLIGLRGMSAGAAEPLRVAIAASPKEFSSLEDYLQKHFHVVCVRLDAQKSGEVPAAAKALDCDVMLLNHYRTQPTKEQLQHLQKYFLSGKPVVGTRKASHAYQNWLEIDQVVFGAKYGSHFFERRNEQTVFVESKYQDHPLVKGFEPFMCGGGLYNYTQLATDVEVLMSGGPPGKSMPVTWLRIVAERHNQRVFYTRYDPEDVAKSTSARDLVVNALFWAADKDSTKYRRP
ncbi:MAG: ThuA domain-containing protein [Pirellulaceae bacterium]|nr:ThuA domain-containing protein [Pirellulaceae bacterium]